MVVHMSRTLRKSVPVCFLMCLRASVEMGAALHHQCCMTLRQVPSSGRSSKRCSHPSLVFVLHAT